MNIDAKECSEVIEVLSNNNCFTSLMKDVFIQHYSSADFLASHLHVMNVLYMWILSKLNFFKTCKHSLKTFAIYSVHFSFALISHMCPYSLDSSHMNTPYFPY